MRKRRPAPSLYQDPARDADVASGRSKGRSSSGTIERGRPSSSRRDTNALPSAAGSAASPASTPGVASPAPPAIGASLEPEAVAGDVATGEVVVLMTAPGPIASGRRATGAASGSPEARLVGATVKAGMSAPEPAAVEPAGGGELAPTAEPGVAGDGDAGEGDGVSVARGRVEGDGAPVRTGTGAGTRDTEGGIGRAGACAAGAAARAGSPALARAASERLGQRVAAPEGDGGELETVTAGSAAAAPYWTLARLEFGTGGETDAAPASAVEGAGVAG